MTMDHDFHFGSRKLNERGFTCCSKPVGCTLPPEGCAYTRHPARRAFLDTRIAAHDRGEHTQPDRWCEKCVEAA